MNKKNFLIILFFIVCLGFFFRFWNYTERFGLAYDQAHDVLVARQAIREGKIPLVGPFSSAGPFQTSGTWYWLIMVGVWLYPQSILAPWVFLTFLCGLLIVGMGFLGRYMEDELFGLLAAALTAVSTAQIAQSVNLANQTPIPIFSFLAIVSAISYMRKKDILSAAGLGFFSSLSASIHLQGMALAILVGWTFILAGKQKIVAVIAAICSAILPMLAIVIWDTGNDFVNIKNMVYYYTKDQFNISLDVLGRRWLTYLTNFWPSEWAHIIGGKSWIAEGIAVLACIIIGIFILQKKIKKEWFLIFISFFCMVVLVRYTRVPLYSSFITFLHPFVLLITAWIVYKIFRYNYIVGILLFVIVLSGSIWKSTAEIFTPQNRTAAESKDLRKKLTTLYPGERFAVYDYKYDETGRSVPAVLYLDEQNLLDNNGRRIGFLRAKQQDLFQTAVISTSSGLVSDLSSSDSATLVKDGWIRVNPFYIYQSTEEWRHK